MDDVWVIFDDAWMVFGIYLDDVWMMFGHRVDKLLSICSKKINKYICIYIYIYSVYFFDSHSNFDSLSMPSDDKH